MALKFAAASSQYLSQANVIPSGMPMSVSAWFRATTTNVIGTIWGVSGAANNYTALLFRGDVAGAIEMQTYNNSGGNPNTDTTAGITDTNWHHTGGTASASGGNITVQAFLDGGNKGTNTAASTGPTLSRTTIGAHSPAGTPTFFLNGTLAEVTLWNLVLADAEFAALATGINSYMVRPANIVGYWPLWGLSAPEPDMSGNVQNMTLNNSPIYATHAPATLWTPKPATFTSTVAIAPSVALMGAICL